MMRIVIDLEWNQPLAGRTHVSGLYGEIIQIGAAKIDEECNVLDSIDLLVKPKYYVRINKDIEKLTEITDEDLKNGLPFDEAVEKLRAWCGDDFLFIEWGPDDIDMLKNNLEKFELDTSWLPPCYDAQLMFADMEMDEDRQRPLNYALFHYKEKPDGAHNALADVMSTVLVIKHLDLEDGLSDDYFRCDYYEDDEDE